MAAEDTQLAARESRLEKLLISLLLVFQHSASDSVSDDDIPDSETPIWLCWRWQILWHQGGEDCNDLVDEIFGEFGEYLGRCFALLL